MHCLKGTYREKEQFWDPHHAKSYYILKSVLVSKVVTLSKLRKAANSCLLSSHGPSKQRFSCFDRSGFAESLQNYDAFIVCP